MPQIFTWLKTERWRGAAGIALLIVFVASASTHAKAARSIDSVQICSSKLPFRWNGNAYFLSGTYTVHLISSVGLDSTATLVLSVIKPVEPRVTIAANALVVCKGSVVDIVASSNLKIKPYYTLFTPNYTVNVGDGTDSNFIYTPKNGDSVKVRMDLKDAAACITHQSVYSNTLFFLVKEKAVPQLVLTTSSEVADGSPVVFSASTTNGGNAPVYTFSLNVVTVQSGSDSVYEATALKRGDRVRCSVYSKAACAVNDTVWSNTIVLLPKRAFELYPNPACKRVTIDDPKANSKGYLYITDAFGKVVCLQKLAGKRTTVDLSSIVSGFYVITIITSEGKRTEKLVVQ